MPGPSDDRSNGFGFALHCRFNATVSAIAHPAGDAELVGALSHRFAEIHALYAALDDDASGNHDFARPLNLNPYSESITLVPDASMAKCPSI